jgi:hypothetical protein
VVSEDKIIKGKIAEAEKLPWRSCFFIRSAPKSQIFIAHDGRKVMTIAHIALRAR